MNKIVLTEEKETLLIPLYGKAKESQKKAPLLRDQKAMDTISQIDYNFQLLKIPEKTNIMMCLRAKLIDNFVKEFLANDSDSVALHLGCGLDSRYHRVFDPTVDWYDVDFKEVMDIRKHFYEETDHYHLIPSSVTEAQWLEKVPSGKKQYIVIAEGLFMYLTADEIERLINKIKERVGKYTLIFDAFSTFTAKNANHHPSIKKTGAIIRWGIDNPEELTKLGMGIRFLEEQYFTSNNEIKNLDRGSRIVFKIADLFPAAKKAQRLLIYTVG